MISPFDLARDIHAGKLDLLCPRMQLVLPSENDRVVLEGSGVVRAGEHGQLYFEMVATRSGLPDPVLRLRQPSGGTHSTDEYVRLVALDSMGQEWRSELLLVDGLGASMHYWQLKMRVRELLGFKQGFESRRCRALAFFPAMRRPPMDGQTTLKEGPAGGEAERTVVSWDRHVHRIGEADVTFRYEDKWLHVLAERDKPFMYDWTGHLCHALEFATARIARPAVVVRDSASERYIVLLSGPFWRYQSRLPPPVSPDVERFWTVVERMLSFADSRAPTAKAVLAELSGVRNGGTGSFQTSCMTLALAVESLALTLLPAMVRPGVNVDALEDLLEHVGEWQGEMGTDTERDTIRSRALGSIRRLREDRAADRLHAWAPSAGVDKAMVTTWKKMRDTIAHPRGLEESPEWWDCYYAVAELLYRLVGSAIEYEGPILRTVRSWGLPDDGMPT